MKNAFMKAAGLGLLTLGAFSTINAVGLFTTAASMGATIPLWAGGLAVAIPAIELGGGAALLAHKDHS